MPPSIGESPRFWDVPGTGSQAPLTRLFGPARVKSGRMPRLYRGLSLTVTKDGRMTSASALFAGPLIRAYVVFGGASALPPA